MKLMSRQKIIKLSLFGPSGSGKTAAADFLTRVVTIDYPNFTLIRLNVADPLHAIQNFAYQQFDLANTGQDTDLLQFLAEHFQPHLGLTFITRLEQTVDQHPNHNLIILNSDCRNNAYLCFKRAGFLLVRLYTPPSLIAIRRKKRGDIGQFQPRHPVEQIDLIDPDLTIDNSGSLDDLHLALTILVQALLSP